MGFSWARQEKVESCVRAAGFSPETLLMDRHRAPTMTRDSICFGGHIDGVCAVGCDRPESELAVSFGEAGLLLVQIKGTSSADVSAVAKPVDEGRPSGLRSTAPLRNPNSQCRQAKRCFRGPELMVRPLPLPQQSQMSSGSMKRLRRSWQPRA